MYLDLPLLKSKYPLLTFNSFYDLKLSFCYLILLIILHYLSISLFYNLILNKCLRKNIEEECQSVYSFKIITNAFKLLFFIIMTALGLKYFKATEFLYKSLGGTGDFGKYLNNNAEYVLNPGLTDQIKQYYNIYLGFFIFEVYLLLKQPLQTDFLIMIIHHLSSILLIVFSFVTNYTAIGSVVLYLMHIGDIFSGFVRSLVYTNLPDKVTVINVVIFLIIFGITRLGIFGDMIINIYIYFTKFDIRITEIFLLSLLILIYLLSLMWIILISQKLIAYLKTNKIEDIYKIKLKKK